MILQASDFTGEYRVAKHSFDDLTGFIEGYEDKYLLELFGEDQYNYFKSDLTAATPQIPQQPYYTKIFNRFVVDGMLCEGLKVMLLQFVYYHYHRENAYKQTQSGMVRPKAENADGLGYNGSNMLSAYNKAVENYRLIQIYICDNSTEYPNYAGMYLDYSSGI